MSSIIDYHWFLAWWSGATTTQGLIPPLWTVKTHDSDEPKVCNYTVWNILDFAKTCNFYVQVRTSTQDVLAITLSVSKTNSASRLTSIDEGPGAELCRSFIWIKSPWKRQMIINNVTFIYDFHFILILSRIICEITLPISPYSGGSFHNTITLHCAWSKRCLCVT